MEDSIIYSLITCRSVPLCHFSTFAGTFKRFCQEFLALIDTQHRLLSYKYNQYYIHCLLSEQIFCFVCITSEKYSVSLAFSFLTELDQEFKWRFPDEIQRYRTQEHPPLRCIQDNIKKVELNKLFQPHMINLVEKYKASSNLSLRVDAEGMETLQQLPHIQSLNPTILRRHLKVPLLIQSVVDFKSSKFGVLQSPKTENRISEWLTRHPYSTIGICVVLCVILLIYFVVIVPLCGSTFQKVDASGHRICWFPTTSDGFSSDHKLSQNL